MSDEKEWAVLVHQTFMEQLPSSVCAFEIERETAKTLVGRAAYRDRQPKEDCVRGLTKKQAMDIEAEIQKAIFAAVEERRQSTARAMSVVRKFKP